MKAHRELWMITHYDIFDRPVMTGFLEGNYTRRDLQNSFHQSGHLSLRRTGQAHTVNGTQGIYYTMDAYPQDFDVLTVTYYDNYDFGVQAQTPATILGQAVRQGDTGNVTGLTTGQRVRILDRRNNQNFYTTLTYYKNDPSAAAIGVFTTQGNKYHRIRTLTDFEGKVLRKQTEQLWVPDIGRLATDETFDYTPQGRPERHNHSVEGPYSDNHTELAFMRYDPLGKQIGKTWDGGLEDIQYTYNIRGWLKQINSSAFKFELYYNQPANGIPLYNGNIAQTRWWSVRDNRWRSYTYRYDALNRLLEADYRNESRGIDGSYDVSLEYDKQGNIQHLTRYGLQENPTNNVMIDNLVYKYAQNNPNRLLKVTDLTNSDAGFRDDGNGTLAGDPDDDYEYDEDGNMTADQNKEISYIAYNHANMPTMVRIGPGEIKFIYDALGNKWYKFSKDGAAEEAKGTAYIFGMQYEFKENNHIKYDWKLMFIGTDEGYVSAVYPDGIDSEFKFQYVYNHTDHLGNIRQNITKENGRLTVLREHNYYPFGLLHRGYNEEKEDLKYDKEQDFIFTVQAQAGRYKYMFQGQERQEDLDLGWDSFKYRNYDYAIGRFFNVDPLAAKYPYNSTYAFQENKLGLGRELEGLELVYRDKDGDFHRGPYNPDNVPNDWERVEYGPQYDNTPTIDLDPVNVTLYSPPRIRQWDGKLRYRGFGKLKEYGLIGEFAYNSLNNVYLTSQVFFKPLIADKLPENPLTGDPAFLNLDGSPHYKPPVIEFTITVMPMVGEAKFFNKKPLNAAEFSSKFKNTPLVKQPAKIRGFFNRTYNRIKAFFSKHINSTTYLKMIKSSEDLKRKIDENELKETQ